MRLRLRLWWEVMPFTAKAALIVLIMGLAVTASARAATLGDDLIDSAPAHHARAAAPVNRAPASAAVVKRAPFRKTTGRPVVTRSATHVTAAPLAVAVATTHQQAATKFRRHLNSPAHMVRSTRSHAAVIAGSLHLAPLPVPTTGPVTPTP